MTVLSDLGDDAQLAVLLDVARTAAGAFGLHGAVVTPVLVAYDATFRVDVGDGSWALRILLGSSSTRQHIDAQQA